MMKLLVYVCLLAVSFQVRSEYIVTDADLQFQHEVCPNEAAGTGRSTVALEQFDATKNGGTNYVTVMMSVFSGCNPGRVDVPAFAQIAERISATTDKVAFLVSAKGGGSCKAWLELTNQTSAMPLIVDDDSRRLHYMYFDYHPQFVILDKSMKMRYKLGSKDVLKLPQYILELLREDDVDKSVCVASEWGEWSECNVSCGFGQRTRSRTVSNKDDDSCPATVETEDCNVPCPNFKGVKNVNNVCADLFGHKATTVIVAEDSEEIPMPRPTDLKFHPLNQHELWVSNSETDSFTVLDMNINNKVKRSRKLRDRHPYHYMDEVSSFSFDSDSGFFATCQHSANTYDGRMKANNFQGPTLYDSDPKWLVNHMNEHVSCGSDGLYGSGDDAMECYLSHHDMLHEAPECAGIVHDPELKTPYKHVYWAFGGQENHLVRFDFELPHGPGSMDHALAAVRRYTDVTLTHDPKLPGHMVIDPKYRQMYIADTGTGRILVVDLESSEYRKDAREDFPVFSSQEPTFEYSLWGCTVYSDIISGLARPTGIALSGPLLYVAEHDTGMIKAYYKSSGENVDNYDTGLGAGLTSLTVSPDGNTLWFTHSSGGVGHVNVQESCKKTKSANTKLFDNMHYFGEKTEKTELCLSEAQDAGMSPIFLHDPGYMNMSGITDEYTNADCNTVNYDAILLNGYFCHKCLRNPCENDAPCVDHRYVGFTCNCSAISDGKTQYTGDKCQVKRDCASFSKNTCEELEYKDQATDGGSPLVCAFSRKTKKNGDKECFPKATFKKAQKICENQGARLCTAEELLADEALGTGCGVDVFRTWTSENCRDNAGFSIAGSSAAKRHTKSKKCEKPKKKRPVVCCADVMTKRECHAAESL